MIIELPDDTPLIEVLYFAQSQGLVVDRLFSDRVVLCKPCPDNVTRLPTKSDRRSVVRRHPTFDGPGAA